MGGHDRGNRISIKKGKTHMKDGIHVDTTNIDEISALQIFRELYGIRETEENECIGRTIEKY